MSRPLTVMLVAAEASGDVLGAGVARALLDKLGGQVRLVGVGGPAMAAEGIVSPFDIDGLSVLGAVEGVRAYPRVRGRVAETVEMARREQPDVAVLIDSWGFTLRVAHGLRRAASSIALVKYVGPQVWATRPGRAKVLARSVDLLLSIHVFEAEAFEREGLETVFVGHHALSAPAGGGDAERLRGALGLDAGAQILLVLPGSRPAEVHRLAGPFAEALRRLKQDYPSLEAIIPVAGTVAAQVRSLTARWVVRPHLIEDEQTKRDAYAAATAALACSGTATLELARAGVPMVVAYRVNGLTHLIAKAMLRTRYITLFNIAAGAEVAPELIQGHCTGPKLARAVGELLSDPERAAQQSAAQTLALERFGGGGDDPSERAASAILELLVRRGAA